VTRSHNEIHTENGEPKMKLIHIITCEN